MSFMTLPICLTVFKVQMLATMPITERARLSLSANWERLLDIWMRRSLASTVLIAIIERTDFLSWRDTIIAWDAYSRTGALGRGGRQRMLYALLSLSVPVAYAQMGDRDDDNVSGGGGDSVESDDGYSVSISPLSEEHDEAMLHADDLLDSEGMDSRMRSTSALGAAAAQHSTQGIGATPGATSSDLTASGSDATHAGTHGEEE